MHSCKASAILIAMIVTGAARSVAVQLFFQIGFTQPLFVTLLYLLGQSLALAVYSVQRWVGSKRESRQRKERLEILRSNVNIDAGKYDGVDVDCDETNDETEEVDLENWCENACGVYV